MGNYIDNNIFDLASAIVLQACRDYKEALKMHDKYEMRNLERFFLSDYFMELTRGKISGSAVIKELQNQVNNKARMLKRRKVDTWENIKSN